MMCVQSNAVCLAMVAAILCAGSAPQAAAQTREDRVEQSASQSGQRHITVSAEGSVSARPDIARLSCGVVTEAEAARDALDANSTAMEKLLSGIKASGISDADIKTTGFDVSPRYENARDDRPPRISGYRVSNDVHIVVRELAGLGGLLDKLVSLGANSISGLSFDVAEAEGLRDEARKRAVANARRRAELFAAAAGVALGRVLVISEDSQHVAPRGPMLARSQMAASVPIAEGAQEFTARVTITYALD